MFLLQADKGLGRHRQTIDDDKYLKLRSYGWVYSVGCAVVSFSLLKISIALSLIRMSKARWFTWSLYALIGKLKLTIRFPCLGYPDLNRCSVHYLVHDCCSLLVLLPLQSYGGQL